MAVARPRSGSAPARSIQDLARIPTPTSASEVNYLTRSIETTCEALAMVIELHAHHLRATLSWPPKGASLVDKARVSMNARRVAGQMKQGAERVRGGAWSMRAAWNLYDRLFGVYRRPPVKGKTFDHAK